MDDEVGTGKLCLVPTGATLSLHGGRHSFDRAGLTLSVRLVEDNSVEFSSGGRFKELGGEIYVYPDNGEPGINPKAIGRLNCSVKDEIIYGEVFLPNSRFEELLSTAKLGHIPSLIVLEAQGLEDAHGFDHEQIQWDNNKFPSLPVISVTFRIPLVLPPAPPEDETPRWMRKVKP